MELNDLNLELLNGLSQEEKAAALQILKEYAENGRSQSFEALTAADFDEIPVEIHTFLHDKRYLGNALYDQDGHFTLYPYWENCLEDIFPDNLTTKYNNIVLTGAIGLGKSTIAVICLLYLLYRLLCLKDPYLYYGMQPIDKISISLMNITLENARGVALDKMNQMILSSEWFLQHGEMAGTTNLIYRPEKHIELVTASSNNQIIGRALFCLTGDTKIKTTTGTVCIDELIDKKINVLSYNDGIQVSDTCTVKQTGLATELFEIELDDGTKIKCTPEHRFLLKTGEYKCAKDLSEVDELAEALKNDLSYFEYIGSMKIKAIKHQVLAEPVPVYDVIEASPYHNFLIATDSGHNIVSHNCNFTDEVNFSLVNNPEKQKKKMMKLITQIDARMKSRFMRGTYLPTLNILASSADTEQSFLEDYIKNKQEHNSKTTLVVQEPQWVVDPRKVSGEWFWVAVGNKLLANELPPLNPSEELLDEFRAKGYELWQVPSGYRETFEGNLDEAICSIIGIATANALKFFSGQRIEQAKVDSYVNPFTKDTIEVGDSPDDHLQYANFFDMSKIDPEDLGKPLFIHLDMSTGSKGKGDKTGIAGVWITGRVSNLPAEVQKRSLLMASAQGNTAAAMDLGEATLDNASMDMAFKLAFSVSVKAPRGYEISFAKNRNFIRWLSEQGFAIKGVSMDQFQSVTVRQDLAREGYTTQQLTVDRTQRDPGTGRPVCLPYYYLKNAIYERRIQLYRKCDLLTDELLSLERKSDGHVDHPQNGSKDQADAVCGATWLASMYQEEYSYHYGDHLAAAMEANESQSDENRVQKVIDYQAMLRQCFPEDYEKPEEEKQEYAYYQDILDGIIV